MYSVQAFTGLATRYLRCWHCGNQCQLLGMQSGGGQAPSCRDSGAQSSLITVSPQAEKHKVSISSLWSVPNKWGLRQNLGQSESEGLAVKPADDMVGICGASCISRWPTLSFLLCPGLWPLVLQGACRLSSRPYPLMLVGGEKEWLGAMCPAAHCW